MNSIVKDETPSFLNIASCSYEGSIFGWKVKEDPQDLGLQTKLTYGFHISTGSLKALSISSSGKYLVTGGMDERIRIYDMFSNRSVGELSNHQGGITCLKFFKDSYLFSGSEDSNICIWRVYDWQCVHILGGHKDAIIDLAVHPTGMLALSISKDHTLKLWNLVQGRCAFTRRLKQLTDQVLWHSTGEYYMLVSSKLIQLFAMKDNVCIASYEHESRINKACFSSILSMSNNINNITDTNHTSKEPSKINIDETTRIISICDDKTLHSFDLKGNKISLIDLSLLTAGRPRDIWSTYPNIDTAITHPDMIRIIKDDGECIIIVTSLGQVLILSSKAIEAMGIMPISSSYNTTTSSKPQSYDGVDDKEERNNIDSIIYSACQIKAEPRLTAVVAWNQITLVNEKNKSILKKHRQKPLYDYDVMTDEEDEVQEDVVIPKSTTKKTKSTIERPASHISYHKQDDDDQIKSKKMKKGQMNTSKEIETIKHNNSKIVDNQTKHIISKATITSQVSQSTNNTINNKKQGSKQISFEIVPSNYTYDKDQDKDAITGNHSNKKKKISKKNKKKNMK